MQSKFYPLSLLLIFILNIFILGAFLFSLTHENNDNNTTVSHVKITPNYTLDILIFTQSRAYSLRPILQSVVDGIQNKTHHDYHNNNNNNNIMTLIDDISINIRFMIDGHQDPEKQTEVINIAKNFEWPWGNKHINLRMAPVGLRTNIMESWYPAKNSNGNEFALFLEDDVELSPLWLIFADAAIRKYWNFKEAKPAPKLEGLSGIALWNPSKNEVKPGFAFERPEPPTPFLLQQPCSWGAIYFPRVWTDFRKFYQERHQQNIKLPFDARVNGWMFRKTWKKYLFRYMYDHRYYLLYPNHPESRGFSFHHKMPGSHYKRKQVDQQIQFTREKSSEVLVSSQESIAEMPEIKDLRYLNMTGHQSLRPKF